MHIYLPVAAVTMDGFVLLAIGGVAGLLSGMFGIGGGILLTPLLILYGVPPAVAVASSANQLVGASIPEAVAHWRRGQVDLAMALVMLVGGLAGSVFGVSVFAVLRSLGQDALVVELSYAALLALLGVTLLGESLRAGLRPGGPAPRLLHQHKWVHGLPLKLRFHRSKLYISLLAPLGLGFVAGSVSAVLGAGGGLIMVPAMIYLLGMPTSMVPGTALFQIVFVSAAVTVLQEVENGTVDLALAMILLVGGTIGAPLGKIIGSKLRGTPLRVALALLALAVAVELVAGMTVSPDGIYTIEALR